MAYSLIFGKGTRSRKSKYSNKGDRMKGIEEEHWSKLIMDSVGDDFEKATEFHNQYKLWQYHIMIEVAIGVGILSLMMLGTIFGCYWLGLSSSDVSPPDMDDVFSVILFWMGSMLGVCFTLTRDNLLNKLSKRKDNIAYHWDKTEGKECK